MYVTHVDEAELGQTVCAALKYVIDHSANAGLIDKCRDALELMDELNSKLVYIKAEDPI